jgi:hypothetical protein
MTRRAPANTRTFRERHWPALFAAAAIALEIALTLPFVGHATERNELIHDTQHGLIVFGGIMLGVAFHEVTFGLWALRGGPGPWAWLVGGASNRNPVLVGAATVVLELVIISPPVDNLTDAHKNAHYAAHGAMLIGGVVLGVAVREAARRADTERRGRRA